jgi:anti-sigma-K factor RskA
MAQTKRRRRTKHRGNAAGVVESRGRTGRRPTAAEKDPKKAASSTKAMRARERREARLDRPPTWRSAFNRAMIAAVLMLLASLFLVKNSATAIALFPIVLALYVPISYCTDLYLYRRRMRNKQKATAR